MFAFYVGCWYHYSMIFSQRGKFLQQEVAVVVTEPVSRRSIPIKEYHTYHYHYHYHYRAVSHTDHIPPPHNKLHDRICRFSQEKKVYECMPQRIGPHLACCVVSLARVGQQRGQSRMAPSSHPWQLDTKDAGGDV